MKRQEMLEFLELPDTASNETIIARSNEKRAFFVRLQEHAPNDLLKNLHRKNVERIDEILQLFGGRSENIPAEPLRPVGSNSSFNVTPAWLIRHTEMMSSRTYPLLFGKTIIGREQSAGVQIMLDDDPYVSRRHAVLEIVREPSIAVYITDGVEKPSSNGVYINANQEKIRVRTKIMNGDTIQIGNTKLILRITEPGHSIDQMKQEVDQSEYMKTVIINLM